MSRTIVGLGDPKAQIKFSVALAHDTARESFFQSSMMGEGQTAQTPIQIFTDLENDSGDAISYDLVMQLRGRGVDGDNVLRGNEENLTMYTDKVLIDQRRHGVNCGGAMTRKRVTHDMRMIAKDKLSDWFSRLFDEYYMIYAAGARGVNPDYIEPLSFTGFATNPFVAPDTRHQLYGGVATSKATLAATDKLTTAVIDKAVTRANSLGGGSEGIPQMVPCKIKGEKYYVMLMNEFSAFDLRRDAGTGGWLDIEKAATTAQGRENPIFTGRLGVYNGVILHKHRAVPRFSDYGAGGNVAATRNLFMGRQAVVCAFGSPGTKARFSWFEELEDRGNQIVMGAGSMFGVKKAAYTIDGVSRDFGVISIDCAAVDPT